MTHTHHEPGPHLLRAGLAYVVAAPATGVNGPERHLPRTTAEASP
ncbi:hypothetical protein M2164_008236 [Streptomyces sp. SAI-208]|nr:MULTISPECIES: hypothetical protein [unclassified Streptomyces]MDH6553821.1 hypothetical protein [Streptomyces sp. SAI-041]MDH6572899.1 hypothetical protein [Streptomyces sp. SAI-117]MDH6582139.1 hypothetical protein [Streptomyces sp. SAI-133]MDH6612601.1 hypothetical protein [Streptomyces sp. SAI-208]